MEKKKQARALRFFKKFQGKIRYINRETGILGALFPELPHKHDLRLTNRIIKPENPSIPKSRIKTDLTLKIKQQNENAINSLNLNPLIDPYNFSRQKPIKNCQNTNNSTSKIFLLPEINKSSRHHSLTHRKRNQNVQSSEGTPKSYRNSLKLRC